MAARVRQFVAASCRWCGRPWIARRRTVRRVRLGCSCLSRASRGGAWRGSASALAACRAADPLALATFIPSRVHILIRSDSSSATTANTLNSSRTTGSVGSCIEPPRLSLTFRLVSSSKMSRASGSERASRSSLVTAKVSPARQAASANPSRVGRGWYRLDRGRHRCDHHQRLGRAGRCAER
jgi:hypothetical protein